MSKKQTNRRQLTVVLAILAGLLLVCCIAAVASMWISKGKTTTGPAVSDSGQKAATLTLAYSPEKGKLIEDLAHRFNQQGLETSDGEPMALELVELTPEEMVTQALAGEATFQALTPDSSVWLDQLNRRWEETQPASEPGTIEQRIVSEPVRYAVTPIVIAAWEESARSLGWPATPVSWTSLQARAQSDPNFKWSHPSTAHASGLLATLAEFYAGAGVQRGLTSELAQAQPTLDFVAAVEKTVRYYGEGELAVIERAAKEGPDYLDAFVVSEQLIVLFNSGSFGQPPAKLVALYPAEGALWADHPLALLETANPTANQRRTFQALQDFLAEAETQKLILSAGYRPADLSIPLDGAGSPLTAANGVDPSEPQTTLQLPTPDVVSVVQNAWAYTKRKTNVYLVVDSSGSMRGDKLDNAQAALRTFIAQIPSDQERVGLVEFNSGIANIIELEPLADNRGELTDAVDNLEAGGNTALLDAVRTAYDRLQREGDTERINAIVAMTDGRENASSVTLRELTNEVQDGNRQVPVVIFCVAYGSDSDYNVLQSLADASGGQVREGTTETIRDLYKILSSYF